MLSTPKIAALAGPGKLTAGLWKILTSVTWHRTMELDRLVPDPTALLVIDEADRLKIAGLEQTRSIFDQGRGRNDSDRYAGY